MKKPINFRVESTTFIKLEQLARYLNKTKTEIFETAINDLYLKNIEPCQCIICKWYKEINPKFGSCSSLWISLKLENPILAKEGTLIVPRDFHCRKIKERPGFESFLKYRQTCETCTYLNNNLCRTLLDFLKPRTPVLIKETNPLIVPKDFGCALWTPIKEKGT